MQLRMLENEDDIRFLYELSTSTEYCDTAGYHDTPVTWEAFRDAKLETMGVSEDAVQLLVTDSYAVIGAVYLYDWDARHRRVCVGLVLAKAYQGKGYGTQVIEQAVTYARDRLHVDVVVAEMYKTNLGSKRVFEQAGFNTQVCLPKFDVHKGRREDVLWLMRFVGGQLT